MSAADRESLLLRGVLDLCLLALLESQAVYGYEVAGRLRARGLPVSAGSVYPLLARLEAAGSVQAQERPSPAGPPRKWWSLTSGGEQTLAAGRESWSTVARAVDAIIGVTAPHATTGERRQTS